MKFKNKEDKFLLMNLKNFQVNFQVSVLSPQTHKKKKNKNQKVNKLDPKLI